jgi:DNA-binding transcriptional ArsR family regulator
MNSRQLANAQFRAISDPTRRAVLDLLAQGERNVTDLVGRFRMSQPAVSQHLRVLRQAGMVSDRRVGRERVYRLRPESMRSIANWVQSYERFWSRKLSSLRTFLEADR